MPGRRWAQSATCMLRPMRCISLPRRPGSEAWCRWCFCSPRFGRHPTVAWASQARDATRRFSTLGTVSVATLMASGIVNAWILVGSVHALFVTEYGRLLMLKLGVFAIMLVFAAVNRFWLTPRLGPLGGEWTATRRASSADAQQHDRDRPGIGHLRHCRDARHAASRDPFSVNR